MPKSYANIGVLVLVAALLVAGMLSVFDHWQMPRPAQISLVILLVAAVCWISEVVPLFVTSFIVLLLSLTWLRDSMLAADLEVSRTVFLSPFFSDIILLFLGGFVLSAALHKYRLDEEIAHWVIARTGRSVPRLLAGIMCITAFLSMWLSNTATAAMMIGLCLPIVRGLPANHPGRKAILLGIPFSANVGGMGTPIGSPPNAIAIQYLGADGAPSFLTWILMGAPLVVVMLAVIWVVLMVRFRGEPCEVEMPPGSAEASRTPRGLLVVAMALVTAIGWLTGAAHGLSAGTVALLPVIVLFGGRLLDVQDLRRLPWDVLMLMGGGLCLGAGMTSSGLAHWLIERLPIEGMALPLLAVMFGVVACAMSSVMSNTATANLLMPIIIGLGAAGVPPLLVAVAFACSLAMALPVSTPPNAIAFSSGEIAVKDMIRSGLVVTLIGLVVTFTLGSWWWRLVGLA